MTRYQGEDIEFGLSLTHLSINDMQSWNDAQRIVAYMYTCTKPHLVKFSSLNETGYAKLTKSSGTLLTGVLQTADTKEMRGAMYCDIYVMPAHGAIEQIQRVYTGINIKATPIKAETT